MKFLHTFHIPEISRDTDLWTKGLFSSEKENERERKGKKEGKNFVDDGTGGAQENAMENVAAHEMV